ncbi:MAG: RHS repeat protein, partial [Nitrospirae bacterium]|nr:RHS repeat protein [Candidatus Troglogloeales bacterium]
QVVSLASTDSQSSLAISYSGAQVTKVQVQDPTGALGASANYGYLNGRLDKVTDPTGGATQYGYDTVTGVMTTITDPRGITYLKNEYDTSGRVVKQTVADGGVSILAYSAETLPLPPLPPSIAPTYPDCTGALTITIALADSNSIPSTNCGVSYSYLVPPSGPVIRSQYTTITDARGTQTRMNFNDAGLVTSQVEALGTPVERTTTHEYDSVTNQKLATTDSLGRRTEYAYDAAGNLKTLTRLAGTSGAVSTTFTYEPTYNQVATITDPLLHVTTFSYDLKGSLIKVTDPQGKETLMTYNDACRPLSLTDPLGHTTTFAYDPQGNLIQTIDPLGDATTRDYDLFNRLTALTNPSAFITQYGYDVINRLTQVNDTQGGGTAFTYDPNGNLLSVTDAKAQTTLYGYNNMDRLANRTDPLLASEGYLYDLEGNLQKFTDRKTQMAQFTYDALNRRTQAAYADGSTTIYTYDAGNRLTQIVDSVSGTSTLAYDNLDRLTSETTPQGIISYTYDAAGRRASMTVTGQATVTYAYDNANRVTGITQGSSIVAFAYDAAGRRISQTLPNGVVTEYSYDVASRLTEIKYMKGSTTLGNLTYSYDATGNKTRAGGTWASVSLPQAVSSTLYNANNQMTQFSANTLTYDANGNLTNDGTKTYSWDARNRLTSMSGTGVTASFMYDALGRRISKTINGVTTKYLYDGNDIVAEIKNGVVTATYLRSLNIDEPFMRTTATGQEFYHADALGSVMALTDSTGAIKTTYTYDPFGNTTVTGTSTNPFQYTGRENDGTGLYYYRARYYSPTLQRFLGEDPIFTLRCLQIYTGGKNAYAYVDNNPIRYVDPFGLDKNECPGRGQVCAVKCGLGGGVSGAVPCAFTTVITGQACDYVCGKIVGIPILDNILCDYICKPIFEKKKNECDRNTQKCVTECRSRC